VTRWWLDHWPYQAFLPAHPEPVEEQQDPPSRRSGWVDESN